MPQPAPAPETDQTSPEQTRGAFEMLKSLGEAAGVLTGLAFIAGWLYWSTYYSAFGLNPLELDFSVAVISVSPIQVIVRDLQSEFHRPLVVAVLVLSMLMCTVLGLLFVHFRTAGHAKRTRLVFIALSAVMLSGGYLLGRHDSRLDASCVSRLPTVAFLTSATNAPSEADAAADCLNNRLDCKLVLHAHGVYYYFPIPDDCSADGDSPSLASAELPDSEVRMIRVQRTVEW